MAKCNEEATPFDPPLDVKCPCECGGILRSDGRNKNETLTFLLCDTCKCCYKAQDGKEETVPSIPADDDDDIEIGR